MLARFDGHDWRLFGAQDGLVGGYVSALTVAPDGTVAAAMAGDSGTGGGLGRWDGKTWQVQTAFDTIEDASVSDVSFDAAGAVWIATSQGAAYGVGPTWQAFSAGDGLGSDVVRSVLPAGAGEVYLGTAGGLTRFRGAVARQVIGGGL
jgi:ligand-binding sensor domain-containing protein